MNYVSISTLDHQAMSIILYGSNHMQVNFGKPFHFEAISIRNLGFSEVNQSSWNSSSLCLSLVQVSKKLGLCETF